MTDLRLLPHRLCVGADCALDAEIAVLAQKFGSDLDNAIVHSRDYMFS